jgi:GNAT superfamily N-acetyltransferase
LHFVRIEIAEVDWNDPVGVRLRRAQEREAADSPDPGLASEDADTSVFLVATDTRSGRPIGCGGVRAVDPATFELTRLYVVPAWRGRPVDRPLLRALEGAARERGATALRLAAGPGRSVPADVRAAAGYRPVAPTGPAAETGPGHRYERVLAADSAPSAADRP